MFVGENEKIEILSDVEGEEIEIVSEHSYEVYGENESVYEDAEAGNLEVPNDDDDVVNVENTEEDRNDNEVEAIGEELRLAVGNPGVFLALERIGANIIVNGRVDPTLPFVAMTNINWEFPVNAIGQRVVKWIPESTTETRTRDKPLRAIDCRLDGEAFKILGVKRIHSALWFPGKTNDVRTIRIRAIEVPHFPHTPDFTLERIELGRPFCAAHLVYVDPVNKYVVVRDDEGRDVTLPFQIRCKRRSIADGRRFLSIREEDFL